MTLIYPIWLLLLIPLAAAAWYWPLPTPMLRVLRGTAILLIVLALAGLAVRLPSRAGTVVVVADRSASMPGNADASQREVIDLMTKEMGSDDRLAVVSFGERAAVERPPEIGKFTGFVQEVGPDGSRLEEALEKSLSLIPGDAPGRIIILSDGRWTDQDPARAAARAASRGIPIDYREIARPVAGDVAIARIDAPLSVNLGESFLITAWVQSPVAQEVSYELTRGTQSLGSGKRMIDAGLNRLVFRDRAEHPGTQAYALHVTAAAPDPVPENNTAKILIGVDGPRPILCVTDAPDQGLVKLLAAGGLGVEARKAEACDWSLAGLSNYAGVLIENVPATRVGQPAMETLAAWVTESGAGLMMTGGRQSFGPGGYFKSPLEPVMPVSMELRREHRKHALAIVVALDRSGSMAMPTPSGRPKMDLADMGAAQVLDLLSPMDEFGCIAVDTESHVIVPRGPVADKGAARSRILAIDSQGGGIFIYEALTTAAGMIAGAEPVTKHIILFSDARDAEEPGDYKDLVAKCVRAGITVSVIGMGTEKDCDANLLKDIAARGNGRIFFSDNPDELPRLFAQDTFVIARSTFVDEVTPIKPLAGLASLTERVFDAPPPVGGYNLCYLRDGATLGVVTSDQYHAPVVAAWQAGLGRAVCYTGEANGEFTGPIKGWKNLGDVLTSLARWTAGDRRDLPGHMMVTQEVEGGTCVLQLQLDPERKADPITSLPRVTTLRDRRGGKPAVEKVMMHWASADTLAAEVALRGDETALTTVEVPGVPGVAGGKIMLSPVCLPYSPEYQPGDEDRGPAALRLLARATGGEERTSVATVWTDLTRRPRLIILLPWLVAAAVVVFLLEVLERRTGALAIVTGIGRRAARMARPVGESMKTTPRQAEPGTKRREDQSPHQTQPQPPANAGLDSALRTARRRSRGRTGGE